MIMKFKNLLATSLVFLTASCWAETAKAFILIDSFDVGSQRFTDSNLDLNDNPDLTVTRDSRGNLNSSQVLGTVRDIQILSTLSTPPPAPTIGTATTANQSTPLGTLEFQKSSAQANVNFRVDYDGTLGFSGSGNGGINPSGLGSVNFASVPENVGIAFVIRNINDLRFGSVATLTVFSNGGNVSGTSTPVNLSVLSALDDITFLFNNSGFTSNLVDFTTVSALRLDLTIVNTLGAPAAISFDQVEVAQIPFEFNPILGVSVVGVLWSLNKNNKSKLSATK
jgi:hypothetical protein